MRCALLAALAIIVAAACGGDGAIEYQVIVRFNETVRQADLDDVSAFLSRYDDSLDFLIQESFPPTGRGLLKADATDFCRRVEAELRAKSYVESVTCAKRGGQAPVESPDQPVTYP